MTLKNITQNIFQPPSSEMAEEKYKGVIFNYFIGVVWVVTLFLLLRDIYLALTLSGEGGEEYVTYVFTDLFSLIIIAGVFWLHRKYATHHHVINNYHSDGSTICIPE